MLCCSVWENSMAVLTAATSRDLRTSYCVHHNDDDDGDDSNG